MSPQTPDERAALARALHDDGKYVDAIAMARRARCGADAAETKLRAYLTEATCQWELKLTAECLESLAQAGPLIDAAPAELRGRFFGQRALIYRNAGEYDKAILDYDAADHWATVSNDCETQARIKNNRAKVYSDLGRFDEAIEQSDIAIQLATELNETILAGRFYDMKAQICLEHGKYEESLLASSRAVEILRGHSSSGEALETHERAVMTVTGLYLREADPVERFRLKRVIVKGLGDPLDAETIRIALARASGQVAKAAQMLNVKHPSLIEAATKHGLYKAPKRRRAKSLIVVK